MKLEEFKAIMHLLPEDIDVRINFPNNIKDPQTAKWKVWSGWVGNHDQRIEDATCTKCGYKHRTVFQNIDKLDKICASCGSTIIGTEMI